MSRGLLHDCTTSPINRFAALVLCNHLTVIIPRVVVAGVSCCLGTLFLVAGILVVVSFRGFVQSLIMAEIPLLPDSQVQPRLDTRGTGCSNHFVYCRAGNEVNELS